MHVSRSDVLGVLLGCPPQWGYMRHICLATAEVRLFLRYSYIIHYQYKF